MVWPCPYLAQSAPNLVGGSIPPLYGRLHAYHGGIGTDDVGLAILWRDQGIFQGINPSSSPIKGGLLPPHSTHQGEEHQSKSNTIQWA